MKSKKLEFVCAQEADGEDAVPRRSTGGALRGSGVQRFSREPSRAGGSVCAPKPAPRCDTLSAFAVAPVRRCVYEKKRRCLMCRLAHTRRSAPAALCFDCPWLRAALLQKQLRVGSLGGLRMQFGKQLPKNIKDSVSQLRGSIQVSLSLSLSRSLSACAGCATK